MDQDINKILEEQFAKLPENIQTAIVSAEYRTKLQEITQRQKLLIDQAGKLEMETTLVMIGLEPLADFVANIQRELELPILRAKEIATDVSENIFKPIRESLRAINEAVENEDEVREMSETIERTAELHKEENLNRDQILNEIEDPSIIGSGRQLETLAERPYQQDIKAPVNEVPKPNLMETKMSDMVITTQQIVDAKPEVKLPPTTEKKRPDRGFDPYREEVI